MADATIDSVDLTAAPSLQTKMPCSDGTGAPATISVEQILALAPTLGADDNYMTDAEKTKLAGIATGAEVNVQADWNASTGDAAIMNKPEIPSINGLLNESAHDALDHSGLPGVPASYTLPVASATVLGGVKVDGTTVLISDGVISSTGGSGGGVTDHGLLTGLSDDDHPQYHNDTRGDARYSQTTHNHSLNNLTEKSYNSLTDKPSIPSVSGLLNETAHAALDHAGLPGVLAIGTTGTTACAGNDSRLSDSRTPTTHSHAQSDVTDLTTALAGKQAALVSGTNIKTINGASVLGSGDIVISGGGASVQQATVTLAQNASTNITATSVLSVYEQVVGASLIPAMTSNTTPYGTVSADSYYSGSYLPFQAMDGNTGSIWNSANAAFPHWLRYVGVSGIAAQYSIHCIGHSLSAPKDFALRHSADGGATWDTLDSRTNITNWDAVNTYTIATPAATAGGIYELYITAGTGANELVIHEFALTAAPTYQNMLSSDYKINRFSASGSQVQVLTRLKTGTADMVIDYI